MPADAAQGSQGHTVRRFIRASVLAAHHNVWWSFANEYDLMRAKTTQDWDAYFQLVQAGA